MVAKRVISACMGNKPPGGVVGSFGLPGESLQVPSGNACRTAETPDSG